MPVTMQNLQTLANNLDQVGKNYLGNDAQGEFRPTTSGLGGRIAARWNASKADHMAANQATVQNLINTLKDTRGITDGQKGHAENILKTALESGKPLSGREAASAIREFIAVKNDEDTYALETRRINAESLTQQLYDGNPSDLDTILTTKCELFGLDRDKITPQELFNLKDIANTEIVSSAVRSDTSLSPEDGKKILDESCRVLVLSKMRTNIQEEANTVSDHSGPDAALPKFIAQMAQEHGVTTPITPDQMGVISEKIHDSLSITCLRPAQGGHMHQATPTMAQEIRSAVVERFLNSMQAVDDSPNLDESQKNLAKQAISASSKMYTPSMVQCLCKSAEKATIFFSEISDATLSKDVAEQKCDTFFTDMENSAMPLREQGLGLDEIFVVREDMGKVALASCNFINIDGTSTGKEHAVFDKLLGQNAPLTSVLYDKKEALKDSAAELHSFNAILGSTLQIPLTALFDKAQNTPKPLSAPMTLGSMSYAKAKERVEADFDSLHTDRTQLKADIRAEFQTILNTPKTNQRLEGGLFGEQFTKDFNRTGLEYNGTRYGSISQDPELAHAQAASLMAQFPSEEVARQVCNPLHQGVAACIMTTLAVNKDTGPAYQEIMMSQILTQAQTWSIRSNDDGTYTASVDYATENRDLDTDRPPRTLFGQNIFASFKVTPQAGQEHALWELTDTDAILEKKHI